MKPSGSNKSLASATPSAASKGAALSNKGTPTAAQNAQLKAWNRGSLRSIAALLSVSDDEDGDGGASTAGGSPKEPKTARTPRRDVKRSKETKAEYDARKRKQEHMVKHQQLLELRAADARSIQEQVERNQWDREQRCERMFEELRRNDVLRVNAEERIQRQDAADVTKRQGIYNEWDTQVYQRVEYRLQKFASAGSEPPPSLGPAARMELHPSDDPVKRCLYQQRQEENFRRAADAIIADSFNRQSGNLQEQVRQRKRDAEAVRNRLTSRPVLPIPNWEQRQHYASPYGYFAQGCEKGTDFHSARRQGTDRHRPDENDGVQAAGKTRTRVIGGTELNSLGQLAGERSKQGESALIKQRHGASCGAPQQDHYRYPQGNDILDLEFPLGKRVYPEMMC